MAQFRKRPIVIEAIQLTDATFDAPHPNPEHLVGVTYDPVRRCALIDAPGFPPTPVRIGDWIIRDPEGGILPCKPDIFAATYEPVD